MPRAATWTFVLVQALVCALVPPAAASAPAVASMSTRAVVTATEDTYIDSAAPGSNFGLRTRLATRAGPSVRQTFLRFRGPGIPGVLKAARLEVYAVSSARGFSVSTTRIAWAERSLTWRNRPRAGTLVRTAGAFGAGRWVPVDVTAAVRRGEPVVLVLTSVGAISYASREVPGRAPRLVLTVAPAPSPSPVAPTPSPSPSRQPSPSPVASPSLTPTPSPSPTPTQTPRPNPTPTPSSGPTVSPTPSPSPQPSPVAPGDTAQTVLTAGDIAGCSTDGDERTAALLDRLPGTVMPVGDLVYESGTTAEFQDCYHPTWGRHKSRTRPTVGNHEYATAGAAPYFAYFGAAAGDPAKGYYSFDLGSWHVISLNGNCGQVGGCLAGSPQEQWLRADLQASAARCTIAFLHNPRFSSGSVHGSNSTFAAFWQALYDAGAEILVSGHDHIYERFAPQTPSGEADAATGVRQFVVGTGGRGHYTIGTIKANSQVRNTDTFGLLQLRLGSGYYDWSFVPEAGRSFTDSGSTSCH